MDTFMRFQRVRDQLAAWSSARLTTNKLERATTPIDAEQEAFYVDDADLVMDDAMRACFGEVGEARVAWQVRDRVGGSITLPGIDTIAMDFIGDIERMAPQSDAEREHLMRLRFIDLQQATDWTAFRCDPEGVATLWLRCNGAGCTPWIDAPMTVDFAGYLEHLLGTRGVYHWPLLYMDLSGITADDREGLLRYSMPMVRDGLTALLDCPGAKDDARRYLARAAEVARALGSKSVAKTPPAKKPAAERPAAKKKARTRKA